MGSMISLAVGRLEIEWGKNNGFTDHSALFQAGDLTQIPYYYAGAKTHPHRRARLGSHHRNEGRVIEATCSGR